MTTNYPPAEDQTVASNMTMPSSEVLTSYSDDRLLTWYEALNSIVTRRRAEAGHIEQEMIRRMNERQALAIPSETFICELEVKNSYDQAGLTPLLEIFNEVELAKCYEPAYSKMVEVPAKWNIQQVLAAARRRGAEAMSLVERARLPGALKLKFARRLAQE